MTSFNHLSPSTEALLDLPDEQRALHMLKDRFITHDRLQPVLEHVDFLRFSPIKSRAAGLVVYGHPGAGKTMLANAVLRRYPRQPASPVSATTRPVLMISMTGAREAKILYNRLLSALDCPPDASCVGSDRERLVLRLCRAAQLKLLVVDEIQDILTSTPRQQRIALDTIKFLMNELSLPILALGTLEAKVAMEVDEHLNARFTYRELPLWTADNYLSNFLDALEMHLPLKKRSCLSAPTIMKELVRVSGGVLDSIVKTVCFAAAHAVEKGKEQVTIDLIGLATRVPPTVVAQEALKRQEEAESAEQDLRAA